MWSVSLQGWVWFRWQHGTSLAGQSLHEGCSKPQPRGGEGESVTSGLVSGWEIAALALMLKHNAFLPLSKHRVAFLVSNHLSAHLQTLAGVCPRQCPGAHSDVLAGLWEGSLCQLWAAAKLQTCSSAEWDLPCSCELPEPTTEQTLWWFFFSCLPPTLPQAAPWHSRCLWMPLTVLLCHGECPVLVPSSHLQHTRAPMPGSVSHKLLSLLLGAWISVSLEKWFVFQNSIKGAIIQNPLLLWKGIAFRLSFYLQTCQISKNIEWKTCTQEVIFRNRLVRI